MRRSTTTAERSCCSIPRCVSTWPTARSMFSPPTRGCDSFSNEGARGERNLPAIEYLTVRGQLLAASLSAPRLGQPLQPHKLGRARLLRFPFRRSKLASRHAPLRWGTLVTVLWFFHVGGRFAEDPHFGITSR